MVKADLFLENKLWNPYPDQRLVYSWNNIRIKNEGFTSKNQCLVMQSIVSLTSSLMTNSLFAVVAKIFSNTLIFLLKNVSTFNAFAIFQDRTFIITLANLQSAI